MAESGIKKTVFEHVEQRRHFGVRITPGKSQRPDTEPVQSPIPPHLSKDD